MPKAGRRDSENWALWISIITLLCGIIGGAVIYGRGAERTDSLKNGQDELKVQFETYSKAQAEEFKAYVPRSELDSRFKGIENSLNEIKSAQTRMELKQDRQFETIMKNSARGKAAEDIIN